MNYDKSTTVYKKICYVKTEQVIYSQFSLSRKNEIETKTVKLCKFVMQISCRHSGLQEVVRVVIQSTVLYILPLNFPLSFLIQNSAAIP